MALVWDKWMCQQLSHYLTAREDTDPEQLLRGALKMYLRREEERAKAKARIMMTVARESVGASNSTLQFEVTKRWVGPPPGEGRDFLEVTIRGGQGLYTL